MSMSGKKFLLDTNIVIAFFNREESVIERIKSAEIFIPSPALGEMYFGAEKSEHKKSNIEKIDKLAQLVIVVPCDQTTTKFYGKIKNQLKLKGTPIPENDVWVAALSEQHQLVLVTRDKHFKAIEKLKTIEW